MSTPSALRRGFTLLEILISAFIMALGVLGLTALFAGSARQQQVSTQLSESVSISLSAASVAAAALGRLEADSTDDPNDLDEFKQPGGQLLSPCSVDDVFFDVWYHVPAINESTSETAYLSVNPEAEEEGLYFLVEELQPTVLYSRDPEFPAPGTNLAVAAGTGFMNNETLNASEVLNAQSFPLPQPYSDYRGGRGFTEMRHRRIAARSVEIRVRYARVAVQNGIVQDKDLDLLPDTSTPLEVEYRWTPYRQPFLVHGAATGDFIPDIGFWEDPGRYAVFYRNGKYDSVVPDYIVLEIENEDPEGGEYGELAQFSLGPLRSNDGHFFDLVVDEIRISRYSWRSDQLVSVADRVFNTEEPGFGERAESGFSVFFSRSATGLTRVAVFTYNVEPMERGGQFVPPETCSAVEAGEGIVREVNVTLGWDPTREQYYVQPSAAGGNDMSWAVEPGAVLLFRGEESNDVDDPKAADLGVRVVKRESNGGNWRGYLDDSPRASGGALLVDRDSTINTTVWAIQDTVASQADGSLWRIRPVEIRIFPVSTYQ